MLITINFIRCLGLKREVEIHMKNPKSKIRLVVTSVAAPVIFLLIGKIYWSGKVAPHPRGSLTSGRPASGPSRPLTGMTSSAPEAGIPPQGHLLDAGKAASRDLLESRLGPARPARDSRLSPACFEVAYHHKELASHSTDDDCSHHRNLIRLPRADANLSSICIRVNDTPVRHELRAGTTDQFVIGPVAGPHDVITARFCVGKARCDEGCAYPAREPVKRDGFLDAIGASDDEAGADAGQWEAADLGSNAEVNNALRATERDMRKEIVGAEASDSVPGPSKNAGSKLARQTDSKLALFKDWLGDPERPACTRSSAPQERARLHGPEHAHAQTHAQTHAQAQARARSSGAPGHPDDALADAH